MRILILGAGALGGLVGAQLTRAGVDVTLLESNAPRARLLADDGLLISRVGESEVCVPMNVVSSVEGLEPFDLVFVAVKTYETTDAVRAALPACHDGTLFLSLQNGVGNAEALAEVVGPHRVLCGITYHSIQHAGPRRLQYRTGIKPIQIAPFDGRANPAIDDIAAVFRQAGLNTEAVPNVEHAIWQKLLHNAVVNPTAALTGLTCREMLGDPDLMAFMRSVCNEIVAVMRAKGVPVPEEGDPFRPIIGSLTALAKNRPSMWQDLSRGKRTEVDALNGAVVAEARKFGLTAPHNDALTHFIHSRERQTFVHKEDIARKLGLGDHRDAAPVATEPAHFSIGRGADAPLNGPQPLDSTRKLKELVHQHYLELDAMQRDPRCLIAACGSLAPVEIVRALGLSPYFPEHHAILISVTGQSPRYIARASAEGFSQFASSAMRTDIGALLERSSPLASAHGIARPPRPDLAVYSTSAGGGRDLRTWFEYYGSHYAIPVLGFHPAPAGQVLQPSDVDASATQLLHVIEQIEQATGLTLEMSALSEVVGLSAEAASLWKRILATAHATPAPLTFFDAVVHLAPMVLLRGTEAAVDYYRLLLAELEDRISSGVGAVTNEVHRFYWDGPPVWCASRTLSGIFAARGIAVVASTYADSFALADLHEDDPVQSLARAYTAVFENRSEAFKTSYLATKFTAFGVDAAVFHDCRTSPDTSHARYGMSKRLERTTSVPAFVLEADSHDPRLFSSERLDRHLADFTEQHRERFADRLVAY